MPASQANITKNWPGTRKLGDEEMDPLDSGALVGWKINDLGPRMVLQLQTMHRTENADKELRERAILLDRNQAVLLANYLYEVTGQSKPKRRGFLQSLFGN